VTGKLGGGDADQDIDFTVLELLRGEALANTLKWRRRMSVAEALPILIAAARGVGAGHRAGLIHRDIKSANQFLERDREGAAPRVRVLDFGIPQIVHPDVPATMLTVFGHAPAHASLRFAGTPRRQVVKQCDGPNLSELVTKDPTRTSGRSGDSDLHRGARSRQAAVERQE